MRYLDSQALHDIAMGAAVLGTGGGGNPHIGLMTVLEVIKQGYQVRVVEPQEIYEDTLAVAVFGIGAPTVGVEKLRGGHESVDALYALQRHTKMKYGAIVPIEVGGSNSMLPLALGAMEGLPVLDMDGMGRAFPEVQMATYSIYGIPASPLALADERGNTTVIDAISDKWMERLARPLVIQKGGHADAVGFSSTVGSFIETGILGTLTLAEKIGEVIRRNSNPWEELLEVVRGKIIFEGKIVDLSRSTEAGFSKGSARIEGMGQYKSSILDLVFQNENLVAFVDHLPIVMVPDLITAMDFESARPLTTEVLRYGLRLRILAMPCHDKWRTDEAIQVVGPRAFGYDFDYVPL